MPSYLHDLGHADLDLDYGDDVELEPAEAPAPSAGRPVVQGISAAEAFHAYTARHAGQSAARVRTPMPAPTTTARPGIPAETPASAQFLVALAVAAGWAVATTYSCGPKPPEESVCAACGRWARVNLDGTLRRHGSPAQDCPGGAPRPTARRVLFTGSRRWTDSDAIERALSATALPGAVVVVGGANGADQMAEDATRRLGLTPERHDADWVGPCSPECPDGHRKTRQDGTTYCPLAGHRRNQAMVNLGADVAVAAALPGSTGTIDCMRRAKSAGIIVVKVGDQALCPTCFRSVSVLKRGTVAKHQTPAVECDNTAVDPAAPAWQTVDVVRVSATSPTGHRLVADWTERKADGAWLILAGDRPRPVGHDALRSTLRALAERPVAAPGHEGTPKPPEAGKTAPEAAAADVAA